jgi:2-methylcitrate dehydratase PrpD
MSALIQWGDWCAELRVDDIPNDVLRRAQLQHISTAGAIRSTAHFDAPDLGSEAAARAGRSCLLDFTDHLIWSQTSPGAVCPTWSDTTGRKAVDLMATTVAANEIGARLGLALGPRTAPDLQPWWIHSLCAAVVRSRQMALNGSQTTHALALALSQCPAPSGTTLSHTEQALATARCVQAGLDAATAASEGKKGPTDWLEATGTPFSEACIPQGARAFTGLGQIWLGRTTAYALQPGNLFSKVAVQATQEILQRHIKAADRRLRVDQVHRIEIRTHAWSLSSAQGSLDPAAVCQSTAQQIGLTLATHNLNASQFHPSVLSEHAEAIQSVASKVEMHHNWTSTIGMAQQLRQSLKPLYGDQSFRQLLKSLPKGVGFPPRSQWTRILKARPDRLLQSQQGKFAELDSLGFRYPFATEVKLFTTRGGWWPERRDTPEGAPGWSWQATVDGVAEKWACGQEGAAKKASEKLDSLPTGAARTWVRGLGV